MLAQGVPIPPPAPPRAPETPAQRAAREAAHQARLAANRPRFDPWLAFPMTLPDGSPANRDSMDVATRAALLALADELRVKYGTMRTEMRRRGIPTHVTFANGEVGEVRLEGSSISLLTNDDVEGADTISTDELWPAGGTGLNLNGTNTVVGIWEVGGIPRVNHLELNGRVIDREGGNPATTHGTGVGSVIAAAGAASPVFGGITYTNGARGMSFAATLWARNTDSNIVELATETAAGLRLSNHSYSTTSGWRQDGANWIWHGSTNLSQTEDWKFGAYTDGTRAVDDTASNSMRHLLVWTPGNSRGEGPATQPISHFLFQVNTNGQGVFTPITSNPPVRSLDGDAAGYDSLHPLGTGKNVLTVGAANFIAGGHTNAAQVTLGSFSPFGPADDGRIKPDVVAQGVGVVMAHSQSTSAYQRSSGTSFAAPAITGSLNLLTQRRAQLHPVARQWLASSQKVLVLHTADEAGEHPGPDFRHGWGLMNTRRAAGLLGANATNG